MSDPTDRETMDRLIAWFRDEEHARPVESYAGLLDTLSKALREETDTGKAFDPDVRWKTLMNAATRIQQSVAEVRLIVADL